MLTSALFSLLIGGFLSAAAFVPVLIWQYRRYGRPSLSRMVLIFTCFVYLTALIAYTIFPIPGETDAFCARHPRHFILDPTQYFREMAHDPRGTSLMAVLSSPPMLQMVLNVALFVPFGLYARRLWRLRPWLALACGFATSLLIELTQYTGNWFLMRCSYRVADINDLLTNTFGAVLGVLLAAVAPHVEANPDDLERTAGVPRPVTKRRHLLAALIDIWWWWLAQGAMWAVVAAVTLALTLHHPVLSDAEQHRMFVGMEWGSVIAAVAMFVICVASPTGRSPGLRTAHLAYLTRARRRNGRLRSLIIYGMGVVFAVVGTLPSLLFGVLLLVELASLLWTPRGLTAKVLGLELVDDRSGASRRPGERVVSADHQ